MRLWFPLGILVNPTIPCGQMTIASTKYGSEKIMRSGATECSRKGAELKIVSGTEAATIPMIVVVALKMIGLVKLVSQSSLIEYSEAQ